MSDTTPVSTTNSNAWAPSMPNSDLWTLKSARDAAQLISPKLRGNAPIPRRVVALPTSPLARLPPWTASISVVAAASVSAAAPAAAPSLQSFSAIPAFLQTLQQPHNRATIGLGHPSTSKRRSIVTATPLQSDSASASAASPQPQPSPTRAPAPVSTLPRSSAARSGSPGGSCILSRKTPSPSPTSSSRPAPPRIRSPGPAGAPTHRLQA
ncbi:hypothetical protein B0H19DRAFT_512251 [Mycena capillaripes]|nr:hypothetical protein B0H19DRAFT_512251 [Mycena capillaripes]